MIIENLDSLIDKLQKRRREAGSGEMNGSVSVGYTAPYAAWVHESPGTLFGEWRPAAQGGGQYWSPGGQPKFLEQPARELQPEMRAIVNSSLDAGLSLMDALEQAGEFLLRESQDLVPIITGELHDSGFTEVN